MSFITFQGHVVKMPDDPTGLLGSQHHTPEFTILINSDYEAYEELQALYEVIEADKVDSTSLTSGKKLIRCELKFEVF